MKEKLKNLISRKFLLAVAGVAIGAIMIYNGQVIDGASLVFAAILAFSVVEGVIDAKSVSSALANVAEAAKTVADATGNPIAKEVEQAAETIKNDVDTEEKVIGSASDTTTTTTTTTSTDVPETATPEADTTAQNAAAQAEAEATQALADAAAAKLAKLKAAARDLEVTVTDDMDATAIQLAIAAAVAA